MRKRVAYITFPNNTDDTEALSLEKKLQGLNIKFRVTTYSNNGMASDAHIDVYNLNRKDLGFLSTIARTYLQKNYLFRLYAGYEGEEKLLFSGRALQAIPDSYPDVILSIDGMSGIEWWGENIEVSKDKSSVMDLIDYAASQMGYQVNIDDNLRKNNMLLNKVQDSFSFTGSPMDLLSECQSMLGGVSSDPQTVFMSIENGQINMWSPSVPNGNKKLLISKETGMIGLPQPTETGCKVKILMNTGIKTGDVVEVKSERIDLLNGDYYVIGITQEGETRGKTWYSTLTCALVSNYESNKNEQQQQQSDV